MSSLDIRTQVVLARPTIYHLSLWCRNILKLESLDAHSLPIFVLIKSIVPFQQLSMVEIPAVIRPPNGEFCPIEATFV